MKGILFNWDTVRDIEDHLERGGRLVGPLRKVEFRPKVILLDGCFHPILFYGSDMNSWIPSKRLNELIVLTPKSKLQISVNHSLESLARVSSPTDNFVPIYWKQKFIKGIRDAVYTSENMQKYWKGDSFKMNAPYRVQII